MTGENIIPPIQVICDKSIFLNLNGLEQYLIKMIFNKAI